ncbi:hypothetical protein [Kosakonia phage Kc304]|uniref:Uncharacterized protein n=2 Tax=Winklervirus chi14 TaxID=2560752 RepID=A0A1Z1LYF0_9CAUD|nr:hypothetical protein FDI23_gp232 [Serratia phage CHI14]ARW57606.1 hypothetical protein [Serratia phage CHI14]ARW57881.1 hypothetical protein [Serratia phage CBH8]QYN80628.1 hypothetical protein [Kosakonia phage Kc304]UJJ22174.1 hypothetical protein [Erwinia phage Virsaitis27]
MIIPDGWVGGKPRTKTLSAHYGEIAEQARNNIITTAKREIEESLAKNAAKGLKSILWYPSTNSVREEAAITKWLQDNGCEVKWNHDQRDGHLVVIKF